MVEFSFSHTDCFEFIKDLAAHLNAPVKNETLLFPKGFASGYMKAFKLGNGLQGTILDGKLDQDFLFQRKKNNFPTYILHFDQMMLTDELVATFGKEQVKHSNEIRSAVLLTCSLFDFSYYMKAGSASKSLTVNIDEEWLTKYLAIDSTDRLLRRYLRLRSSRLNFEPMDAEYRKLLNEIFDEEQNHPLKNIILENRVSLLVELFFTRMHARMSAEDTELPVSNEEMQRLMLVESRLVEDFTKSPPPVKELARLAAMSESKFKSLFKKVYGNNPYEYFQKNRMFRAEYLLRTKKYSVKEVGAMLGYTNLSNFTIAFKKEFGIVPSLV